MTLTRAQTRAFGYNAGIRMGSQRTADSFAANGLSVADAEEYTGAHAADYVGAGIYRPGVAAVDQFRRIHTLSGGSATHRGLAWSDLTTLAYELLGLGLEPGEVNDVIQQALRILWVNYYWPLGWHADNDFAQALTTGPDHDWTSGAVNTTSVAKGSTGGVWTQAGQTGPRNLIHTGDGAGNGYVISSRLAVVPEDNLFHGAIARVNTAGATGWYRLWDVTNDVIIGSAITFTGRAFQRIARQDVIPTGCYQVEVRIGNVTASAATEWDCLFGHKLGIEGREILLPTWCDERWRFYSFGPAYYGRSTGTNLQNATSRKITTWDPGNNGYQPLPQDENASISILQVNREAGLTADDFWVYARRPRSDFETLDNETDTTNAGDDEMREAFLYLLFTLLDDKHQGRTGDDWAGMAARWQARVRNRRRVTPAITPTHERPVLYIGL